MPQVDIATETGLTLTAGPPTDEELAAIADWYALKYKRHTVQAWNFMEMAHVLNTIKDIGTANSTTDPLK